MAQLLPSSLVRAFSHTSYDMIVIPPQVSSREGRTNRLAEERDCTAVSGSSACPSGRSSPVRSGGSRRCGSRPCSHPCSPRCSNDDLRARAREPHQGGWGHPVPRFILPGLVLNKHHHRLLRQHLLRHLRRRAGEVHGRRAHEPHNLLPDGSGFAGRVRRPDLSWSRWRIRTARTLA
jgi:hypothetical protein